MKPVKPKPINLRKPIRVRSTLESFTGYRCQFCGQSFPTGLWKQNICPNCGRPYDPVLKNG